MTNEMVYDTEKKELVDVQKMQHGGPGSGRYPAGSGGKHDLTDVTKAIAAEKSAAKAAGRKPRMTAEEKKYLNPYEGSGFHGEITQISPSAQSSLKGAVETELKAMGYENSDDNLELTTYFQDFEDALDSKGVVGAVKFISTEIFESRTEVRGFIDKLKMPDQDKLLLQSAVTRVMKHKDNNMVWDTDLKKFVHGCSGGAVPKEKKKKKMAHQEEMVMDSKKGLIKK